MLWSMLFLSTLCRRCPKGQRCRRLARNEMPIQGRERLFPLRFIGLGRRSSAVFGSITPILLSPAHRCAQRHLLSFLWAAASHCL